MPDIGTRVAKLYSREYKFVGRVDKIRLLRLRKGLVQIRSPRVLCAGDDACCRCFVERRREREGKERSFEDSVLDTLCLRSVCLVFVEEM